MGEKMSTSTKFDLFKEYVVKNKLEEEDLTGEMNFNIIFIMDVVVFSLLKMTSYGSDLMSKSIQKKHFDRVFEKIPHTDIRQKVISQLKKNL
jgi:hypothetical protein